MNLFIFQKNRKNTTNENLYYADFLHLIDGNSVPCFRILYSTSLKIMTIHLIDLLNEQNRKDYLNNFVEFIDNVLQESYERLKEENQTGDDPFTIFLERNKRLISSKRNCYKPAECENNLVFRVNIFIFIFLV